LMRVAVAMRDGLMRRGCVLTATACARRRFDPARLLFHVSSFFGLETYTL
jgi:hypothetical protein